MKHQQRTLRADEYFTSTVPVQVHFTPENHKRDDETGDDWIVYGYPYCIQNTFVSTCVLVTKYSHYDGILLFFSPTGLLETGRGRRGRRGWRHVRSGVINTASFYKDFFK